MTCNTCAHSNESVYTDTTKASIQRAVDRLPTFCQVVTTKPPNDPDVTRNIPNPDGIVEIVREEEEENENTNPGTIRNPFGESERDSSSSSSSSSSKGGIPNWGIGVAAAGGAVVVAALVSSVVACNYECDPDHRRLRRRRKKGRKGKKNDTPPPEPLDEEKPQLVGYIYPTQTNQTSGHIEYGAHSPSLSMGLSPAVSIAQAPLGPPMSPPISQQTSPQMSPPLNTVNTPHSPPMSHSPPPMAQHGQQAGYFQSQVPGQYPAYQSHPGGQQY